MEISIQSCIALRKLLQPTAKTKKHSSYQILAKKLQDLIGEVGLSGKPKYERERLHYILSKIDVVGKSILDVGCNTGYFTFELIDAGARKVVAYEGGASHFAFLNAAVDALDEAQRIVVRNKYFRLL